MTREEHVRRWSAAHGGTSASPLVRWWLDGVRSVASPLAAAGVRPSAITVAGLLLAVVAVVPAWLQAHAPEGARWALAVPLLLGLAAVADGLDGAVAVLSGTASRGGAVLDAVCDRLADAAALAVLWILGAPALPVLVAVAAGQLHEYTRARAQGEGLVGPGVVTVSERPTRVLVAAMFALGCGVYPQAAAAWATAGAWVAAAAALVGLLQLLVVLRRRLSALD
ncbi:CDP-diacylglycerol--glycerol-3-phosphate 3-phosphatidyltransferase [Quadrisphaera granulorum]|uniref:CDP-diacylglycerol--glycerol-3-phosphate 3-phosphatidyltransferase n=1 Tax=Quadrisphaera granulorum TaxID=317664 RepID=A0A316A7W9_9ACTN|nr:CDP-alcohol phosphatidyltransferase family protein [Quadrisphaera granulorum]PWJ53713.1 CDP-diacylglycerol--glycerol-3-phosphate 3-phosphatidyltransferase [Quadrisphaera granulorum]SZE96757.1 CDP-diacylglycerol--glycerol-3-phosphate 3-phosphatidyltransferase [Quadrisphaera granulorum]